MTIMLVYTVRDVTAEEFGRPFYSFKDAVAVRGFSDQINDPMDGQNDLFKHPTDYELYALGAFDSDKGTFDLFPEPKLLISGAHCKKQVQ